MSLISDVFSGPNTEKYGTEKLRIWILFTQWLSGVFLVNFGQTLHIGLVLPLFILNK